MPRPPSHQARFGTDFHAWVEARFGQQALIEPDDLWGRADAGIDDAGELQEVISSFEARALRRPCAVTPSRRRSRWSSPVRWSAVGSTPSTARTTGPS